MIAERYPIYAEADLKVGVKDEPIEATVERVAKVLATHEKGTQASPREGGKKTT